MRGQALKEVIEIIQKHNGIYETRPRWDLAIFSGEDGEERAKACYLEVRGKVIARSPEVPLNTDYSPYFQFKGAQHT